MAESTIVGDDEVVGQGTDMGSEVVVGGAEDAYRQQPGLSISSSGETACMMKRPIVIGTYRFEQLILQMRSEL